MRSTWILRGARSLLIAAVFAAGYLCGSVSHPVAQAQLGELGGAAMEKAAGSGGAVGNVAQMGTALSEMEQHLSGLQKNLDSLKKVKAMLGG